MPPRTSDNVNEVAGRPRRDAPVPGGFPGHRRAVPGGGQRAVPAVGALAEAHVAERQARRDSRPVVVVAAGLGATVEVKDGAARGDEGGSRVDVFEGHAGDGRGGGGRVGGAALGVGVPEPAADERPGPNGALGVEVPERDLSGWAFRAEQSSSFGGMDQYFKRFGGYR